MSSIYHSSHKEGVPFAMLATQIALIRTVMVRGSIIEAGNVLGSINSKLN
jgi:hypothetical protein